MNGAADEMDVDTDTNTDYSKRKVLVVGEEDLDSTCHLAFGLLHEPFILLTGAKASFNRIFAFHIYSLSATPLPVSSYPILCIPVL